MNNHYIAESGKTFKSKLNESLVGEELYLGIHDSIDNYEEVLANAVNQESEQEGTQEEY